jgi:transposase
MIAVGIDISASKFDVAIFDGKKFNHFVFEQSYDSFQEFLKIIKSINDEYVIAMESTGTYHLSLKQFLKENNIDTIVLHPYSLKNFMKSFSHSKTDKIDAKNIAKAIHILGDWVIKSFEPDDSLLELRNLLRSRKSLIKHLTALKTQLKNDLKKYMPEILKYFSEMDSPVLLKLLSRYPTSQSILKHKRKVINLLSSSKKWKKEKAVNLVNDLKKSIGIKHDSAALLIKTKIELMKKYYEQLNLLENEIEKLANVIIGNFEFNDYDNNDSISESKNEISKANNNNNDNNNKYNNKYNNAYKVITSIPGSGDLITPFTIISEIGDISRFKSKKHFISYIGLDPVITQSGNKYKSNKISKKGNSHLRRIFSMWATRTLKLIPYYKEKYDNLIKRGKLKKVALTAITRKLAELVYTLLKYNVEYNPKYLNNNQVI